MKATLSAHHMSHKSERYRPGSKAACFSSSLVRLRFDGYDLATRADTSKNIMTAEHGRRFPIITALLTCQTPDE